MPRTRSLQLNGFFLPSSPPPCPPLSLPTPTQLPRTRTREDLGADTMMTAASVYALTQAQAKLANPALPPPLTSIRYSLSLFVLPPPFTLPPLPQDMCGGTLLCQMIT